MKATPSNPAFDYHEAPSSISTVGLEDRAELYNFVVENFLFRRVDLVEIKGEDGSLSAIEIKEAAAV